MDATPNECPVCSTHATIVDRFVRDEWYVECLLCGCFEITRPCALTFRRDEPHPYLSGALRQKSTRDNLVLVTLENWKTLETEVARRSPAQRFERLLRLVEARSKFPGDGIQLDPGSTWPCIGAADPEEFSFYLRSAHEQQMLESSGPRVFLTMKGWNYLNPFGLPKTNRAFIAMWFDATMDAAANAIERALAESGYDDYQRIDRKEYNGQIMDRIVADLRTCSLVVADFTGNRQNVYFEAGFAQALGIPVIFTRRDPDETDVHFDVDQYNFIRWKEPEELRAKLALRIQATAPVNRISLRRRED